MGQDVTPHVLLSECKQKLPVDAVTVEPSHCIGDPDAPRPTLDVLLRPIDRFNIFQPPLLVRREHHRAWFSTRKHRVRKSEDEPESKKHAHCLYIE